MTLRLVQPQDLGPVQHPDTGESELSSLSDSDGSDRSPLNTPSRVCDTEACRMIANEFKRGMNTSAAPCDNFYNFVCGSWNLNQLPGYTAIWNRFRIFQETVYRRIKSILEKEPEISDILPVRQAKKWYRACMDVDALEKRGLRPLESILLQVGGWPMTLDAEQWHEQEHTWQSVEHSYFHVTGSFVFYQIESPWFDDPSIRMKKGSIPLERQFPPQYRNYAGDDYEDYAEFVTAVTRMFVQYNKAAVTEEMIEKDVEDLVEFEKELYMLGKYTKRAAYEASISEFMEWYNTNVTEIEFDKEIVKIDFPHLIQRQFDLINREISDSDNLNVDNILYYVKLTKLLNDTPARTIVNYIHWHFVSEMLIYTTEAMRDTFFVLMRNEFAVKERKPRWLECIGEMKMKTAAAYAFVEEYFSPELEETVRDMTENIREQMNSQIDGSSWMDNLSKTMAKEKLNDMHVSVGFPDWYKNKTSVSNSYKGLMIGYDHFDNVLSFKKYEIKELLRETSFESQFDDMIGGNDPIVVNAFYKSRYNHVVLPAADFQPPLFTTHVPPGVNYGMVGLLIGHEMGHGFDDDGILLGKDGDETKLSENMLDLFSERSDCFVDQFNHYYGVTESPDSDELTRGQFTLSENMADSTGIQSVYKAFRKAINNQATDNFKLPGLEDYTDDQMFFISFAAMWCEVVTPKMANRREHHDVHSPGRFRVMGAISNMNEFAEAFNCPTASPMNPEKKCNIWK